MWQRLFFPLIAATLVGAVSLDQLMSYQEMKETGVNNLSYTQKKALEKWIDARFEPKESLQIADQQIYLSLNIENGAKLELSDGSVYEINPDDRLYTAYWITPFPIQLSQSADPNYPVKITNLTTGTSVSGKQISFKEVLEEEKKQTAPPSQAQEETTILEPKTKQPQTTTPQNTDKKPPVPKGSTGQ